MGDLEFLNDSGNVNFKLDDMSAVAAEFPGAEVGNWKLTGSGAQVELTPPPEVQSAFETTRSCGKSGEAGIDPTRPVDVQSAYSDCMLENGVKSGVAGAIAGCVAGSFAAGVGCVAAILPGATGGYISGLVIALWDCKDKL